MFSIKPSSTISRRRGRAIGAAALVLGMASSTAACSVAGGDTDASDGGDSTIRIVLSEEPPTLEPCEASSSETGTIVRSNITEPLMEMDQTTSELAPLLATKWEQTSENLWTFTLRDDVKFSDGTDFDAEAAAYSIDRAVNSDLGCDVEGSFFGDVDLKVEAPDATTLTVETPKPDPVLPVRLSFIEMVPTSTSATEKVREPIGTGPYAIESWEAGQRIALTSNEHYWGEAPAYANATYVWRDQGTVRAAMVLNDEADIATELGPDDGAGDALVSYPNNETTAIRMQVGEAPLNDIRVRQAINYATDREGITTALFGEDATLAAQLVTSSVLGHSESLEPWPYDPEKAKDLLAEAKADGVDVSKEIMLAGSVGGSSRSREVYQVVQKNLSDIGLNVKIKFGDDNFTSGLRKRPFREDAGPYMLIVQHGNQAGDSAFTLDTYVLSSGFQSSGGSDALDAKILAAEALSGEERDAALQEVWAMEPTEVGQYSYLAHMNGLIGVSPDVNFEPNPGTADEMRLSSMSPAS
jgi:peptide/nickel transport system substrate-binding protein